jgi:enoyl-CoA hydratase/carnithine racemase
MNLETIRYEVADGIALLSLHRPDALNAFNRRMLAELLEIFDRIDGDDGVRAVIVTGTGRAFCAGADLKEDDATGQDADGPADPAAIARDTGGVLALRIFDCLKPVIAAINGPAVGVGVTMTLPMDIRLASVAARFGFVFARRGIVPESASSYFLPRVVGIGKALEWSYSGRVFPAAEALAGGLVTAVYPAAELLPAARTIAREIADCSAPVSVALIRQMMWRGLGHGHPMEAHRIESRGIAVRTRSRDMQEGVRSFFEKRPAVFPDRVSADMPAFFPWWGEQPYE